MAQGLFNLKQQLQGLIQKAWSGQSPATYSGVFNNSNSSYLNLGGQSTFAFGTNAFTIEFWMYTSTVSVQTNLYDSRPSGTNGYYPAIYMGSDASINFYVNNSNVIGSSASVISANNWYHVAVSKSGSSTKMFLNGTQVGSTYSDTNTYLNGASAPTIGCQGVTRGSFSLNGYISNLRVVNGTGVYTSNFTVPTAPLTAITNTVLLTLQSINIVDNSTNAYSITNVGGVLPDNKNPFNTPNVATPAVEYLVVAGGGGGGNSGNSGGGGGGGLLQGLLPITLGTSYSVTVGSGGPVNTSGQNSVLGSVTAIGGGSGGVGNNNGSNGGSGGGAGYTSSPSIGGNGLSGQGNAGGISTGGSSAYGGGGGGGAGTVGLNGSSSNAGNGGAGIASAISGTVTAYAGGGGGGGNAGGQSVGGVGGGGAGSLQTTAATAGGANTGGGGGGFGGSSSGAAGGSGIVIISYPDIYNAPSAFGGANSPTASTSGSGSISFTTSTYLTYADATQFNLSGGSYTLEAWIYPTGNYTNYNTIVAKRINSSSAWEVFLSQTTGYLAFFNGTIYSSSVIPTSNVWSHIAAVYDGTNINLYLNGVRVLQTAITNTNYSASVYVGSFPTYTEQFLGQVTNVRITKGVAVYTGSSFSVPTTPLTSNANVSMLLNSVSGAFLADGSSFANVATTTGTPTWNQASPFATGLGYKNRVYTWTGSGTVTF